ncbi:MAG TPA: STAS domain-containing protein [Actinomycetota bacterium]|nr:STAS domain-containing protein [Actinomycetota bacterium]
MYGDVLTAVTRRDTVRADEQGEPGMPFRVVSTEDARTFRLEGELDLATVDELIDRIGPTAEEPGDLRLDATDLSFIDSSGLHGLLSLARKLSGRGTIVVEHATPFVREVFSVTGLDRVDDIRLTDD